MNLAQLYAKLLSVLAESATPQYWSQLELYGYLNDGLIEFVRRTKILQKTDFLDKNEREAGAYFLPLDLIEPLSVQYKGRPLDKKNSKFFEVAYAGTAHQRIMVGLGNVFAQSWRELTGPPSHWFFENQFVKLFPKPVKGAEWPTGSQSQETIVTWREGSDIIRLPIRLPYDKKDSIDVYVDGAYQHSHIWEVNSRDNAQIIMNWYAGQDSQVQVVRHSSVNKLRKLSADGAANDEEFHWPACGYSATRDSVRVILGYDKLTAGEYTLTETENGGLTVTLSQPLSSDSVIEATIFTPPNVYIHPARKADDEVTLSYVHLPASLLLGSTPGLNEPDIPAFFHDACWQWAAFLALSKEGEKTQDVKKSQIFLAQFESSVANANSFVGSEIDIDPAVQMPWRL